MTYESSGYGRELRKTWDRRLGSGRRIMLTRRHEQMQVVNECRKYQRRLLAFRRSGKDRRRTPPQPRRTPPQTLGF